MINQYCDRHQLQWDNRIHSASLQSMVLLDYANSGSKEFLIAYSELIPGQAIPMHCHEHSHSDFIISGHVWAQLGNRKVELEANSATYFPAGTPHAYEAIGNETLCYYSIFPCEQKGQDVITSPVDQSEAMKLDRPNMDKTRWAVAESFEKWMFWEPSKGIKGIQWTSLFDSERGGHDEMIVGTMIVPPGGRYSKHYHGQPEAFIGLEGRGVLFCRDEVIKVKPGVAVYVAKKQIHGAQCHGSTPFKMIWVYGTEIASTEWSWTPVEDIYLEGRPGDY
jgi:quercetin dioxygenase-like cupin family protein